MRRIGGRSGFPRRLAVLGLVFLASAAGPAGDGEPVKLRGTVEERTEDWLLVDSAWVRCASSTRITGERRRVEKVKVGMFVTVTGEWRKTGEVKARRVKVRKEAPGKLFAGDLWKLSDKESRQLRASDKYYEDPAVQEYVETLGHRLVPAYARDRFDWRFRVLDDPDINAFAYPNGNIYVHTGLLARVRNEDQLASVLGHEIAHVTQYHGQRNYRSALWKGLAFTAGTVVLEEALEEEGRGTSFLAGLGLQLGYMAAVNGFGRNMEDQADRVGLRYTVGQDYNPREAPRVWNLFNAYYGDVPTAVNVFYGNHSTNKVRRRNQQAEIERWYREQAAVAYPDTGPRYDRTLVDVIARVAVVDFEREKDDFARAGFERVLAVRPDDPDARKYLAKLDARDR